MYRPQLPRRFPMTLASLALLSAPLGCGSEPPMAEMPAPPTAVADSPTTPNTTPMPGTAGAVEASTLDQVVQQASGDVKAQFGAVEAGANQAAGDGKDLERKAQLDVQQAAGQIEGEAKKTVQDVKTRAKISAEDAKAKVKRREELLEGNARKAAEDALDNMLGNPK